MKTLSAGGLSLGRTTRSFLLQQRNILILLFLGVFLFIPNDVHASITTNKTQYVESESVEVTCTIGHQFQVYSTAYGNEGVNTCELDPVIVNVGGFAPVYTFVEIPGEESCNELTIEECRVAPWYIGEVSVSFVHASVIGSGSNPIGLFSSYRPEVTVIRPRGNTVVGYEAAIEYSAFDKNDNGGATEKTLLGFGPNPISFFYSDVLFEWDHSIISAEDKKLIAKDISATSSYRFKTDNLIPGVPYRIIVDAIDAIGDLGEDVSDFFIVDLEAPQFRVSTNPPVTRNEDVTIRIEASKELVELPRVFVTQQGGTTTPVAVTGSGVYFEGIYSIIPGFDGVAHISVSGTDRAGNRSDAIVSGGTFAIGINPPPAPHLLTPGITSIATTSLIAVTGTTRADTTVVVRVNGTGEYEVNPEADGTFTIRNIALSPSVNRGINIISVSARDQAGLSSEEVSLEVKYNIDPVIEKAVPVEGTIIKGRHVFEIIAPDGNGDLLSYTYQIIPASLFAAAGVQTSTSSEASWITLADRAPSSKFSWDSTEVDDGSYFFRVTVDDGTTSVSSNSIPVSVKNTLPYFRFEDGRRTVTGTSTATIIGRALTPDEPIGRASIVSVEYSLDSGTTWQSIGLIQAPEIRFTLPLSDLTEGSHGILFRARDTRDLIGRASHPVIFDNTPPAAPSITSPRAGQVITDADDTNRDMAGTQFAFTGKTEQFGAVELSFDGGAILATKAVFDGTFKFKNLPAGARGIHSISVVAKDAAGNASPSAIVTYVYNNPPSISFLTPQDSRGLQGKATVSWKITDADGDAIRDVLLTYQRGKGASTPLSVPEGDRSAVWNTSALPEGRDYHLVLSAEDGLTRVEKTIAISIDRTAPTLSAFTLANTVLGASDILTASGEAGDALSGIEFVEYAIAASSFLNEGEREWYRALITKGFLGSRAGFSIKHPLELPDGEYRVFARAVDAAGNISEEFSQDITIDRVAPRVGSFFASLGSISISPDLDGVIALYPGTFTFALSLEGDTANASLSVGGTSFPITRSIASGLWEGLVTIPTGEEVPILLSAEDVRHNRFAEREIGVFTILAHGSVVEKGDEQKPIADAGIRLFVRNEGRLVPFDVSASGEEDILTEADGTYTLAVPPGTYTVVAHARGYRTAAREVTADQPVVVNESFVLARVSGPFAFFQNIIDYLRYSL